ncbi:MAG: CoA transferase, partial [Dehalococcoidia bacterium]
KGRAELFDWAIARGVMLAPLQTLADVMNDHQLSARAAWREQEVDGVASVVRVPGAPVRLSAADWEPRGAAPALGAHDSAVYGGLLGLTAAQTRALDAIVHE